MALPCRRNTVLINAVLLLSFGLVTVSPGLITYSTKANVPKLLLISMDGFRWDYLRKMKENSIETPHFDMMIQDGCTIKDGGMINTFPTKTQPNHFSIVTGLTAEQHGVVGNVIYDPVRKADNKEWATSEYDPFWYDNGTNPDEGAEPIWITNMRGSAVNGHKRGSGTICWPGTRAKIHGRWADQHVIYEPDMDALYGMVERVEVAIKWLKMDSINLVLLYFDPVDHVGHMYGPDSKEVRETVKYLDGILGRLMAGLKEEGLWDHLNVILTSDHGMAEIFLPQQIINFRDYVSTDTYKAFGQWSNLNIFVEKDKLEAVYQNLSVVPSMTVWRKEEVPQRLHYQHNRRIGNLVAVANQGWIMNPYAQDVPKEKLRKHGEHGYDNSLPDMHPIFIARGPNIKKGCTVPQFNNTDIYLLMCSLLDVKPAQGQGGTLAIVQQMIREEETEESDSSARSSLKESVFKPNKKAIIVTSILVVSLMVALAGYLAYKRCRARKKQYNNLKQWTMHTRGTDSLSLSSNSDEEQEEDGLVASDGRKKEDKDTAD